MPSADPMQHSLDNNVLTSLVENSRDYISLATIEGDILYINEAGRRMLGLDQADVSTLRFPNCLAPEDKERLTDIILPTLRSEKHWRGELNFQHFRTEQSIITDSSLFIVPQTRNGNPEVIAAVSRDMGDREQALRALQQNADERAIVMEAANRVALDILANRTGVEALRHIAEAACTLAHARYAALGVARLDGRGLLEFVTTGLTAEEEAAIGPRPRGLGVLGLLLKRTEPLRIDALNEHPGSAGFPPNHPPMHTFLGVPIRRGDTVLGSLYLTEKEGDGAFTEADEVAVQALGAHAAIAIQHLHLLSRQRALLSGLIAAQEEERRAIAYDLHDGLTQFVMASHAHFEAFRHAYEAGKTERAEREIVQGQRYLKEAVVESRRLVNGLRSLALDDLGLAGVLEQLLNEEKARAGWQVAEFLHNVAGRRYHKNLETTVYRVIQESLTNAYKHAQTRRIRLTLLEEEASVTELPQLILEVRDWGMGFDPEERVADFQHVGLHSMSERVNLIGGTYTLHSAPGEGTTIRATFPALEPEQGQQEEANP